MVWIVGPHGGFQNLGALTGALIEQNHSRLGSLLLPEGGPGILYRDLYKGVLLDSLHRIHVLACLTRNIDRSSHGSKVWPDGHRWAAARRACPKEGGVADCSWCFLF